MVEKLVMSLLLAALVLAGRSAAAPGADSADRFYDPGVVQHIRIEIKPEDLEKLNRALPKRILVPATFRWKEETLQQVGIRYKGNSSSNPRSPHKRGFLIAFSEFQKGQRFLGLRHAALDNGIEFGSLFSEPLITDVLRRVGVKTTRCNYARVTLNGKSLGVYVNVERIDKNFLRRHFGTDRGALLKADEGGPGTDLRLLGDDPALYRRGFELHGSQENQAYAELLKFIRAVNAPLGTEEELRRKLDVDAFLKTTAVLLFAGAFDQYTGWAPHNYYLYQHPISRRWTYLPWDLDVGFADHAFGRIPVLEDWNAAWPVPVPERPLMEQLISHPNLLRQYREEASAILETWFRPEILIPKLRALYDQIRVDLAEDPFPARRATVPSDAGYEDIVASMESFIRQRYTLARAQLDAPGQRPPPQLAQPRPEEEGPKPGPPGPDAPTELQAIKVTSSSVELRWKDRNEWAVAYVVQRGAGPETTNFMNAIGQEGATVRTATDQNVEPGKTYRYRVYAVLPTLQGPRGGAVSEAITVRVPSK